MNYVYFYLNVLKGQKSWKNQCDQNNYNRLVLSVVTFTDDNDED